LEQQAESSITHNTSAAMDTMDEDTKDAVEENNKDAVEKETKSKRKRPAAIRYNPRLLPAKVSADLGDVSAPVLSRDLPVFLQNLLTFWDVSAPVLFRDLPVFLQNLLTRQPKTFRMNNFDYRCYFVGGAWNDPGEAQYILVRECYERLFAFVSDLQSKREKSNRAIIAGTAGIGKSLFGLYAARQWFDAGKLVVLWFGDNFWVFSKEKNKDLTLALEKFVVGDTTIHYAGGKATG
jgi:hypothetical protein